jgi:hypothetical protein
MTLLPDWREFIALLNSHSVEYIVVGAWARSFYGVPRATGDIDFFVRCSPENASRLVQALDQFGFGSLGITPDDLDKPDRIIQLGIDPYRIDIVTGISSVTFEEAWQERVNAELDGLPVFFLSRRLFRKNKQAAGRPKDLADLDALPED